MAVALDLAGLNEAKRIYDRDGYLVLPQLFSSDEVTQYREHYMRLRQQGSYPADFAGVDLASKDPLKRFPRMCHMHRWDELSLKWLLDPRLRTVLTVLLGQEPFAVQTMLYFKPAGARGQALHQDQYYLKVRPGTCMAAWLALDPCDESNGCMRVVPGSHEWPVLCPQPADTRVSFTDVETPLPEGTEIRAVLMEPGDLLFFNGSLVHGSYPNTTPNRFRRSLIGHYISGQAEQVTDFDQPVLRMDGSVFEMQASGDGGPCGVWAEAGETSSIVMRDPELATADHE